MYHTASHWSCPEPFLFIVSSVFSLEIVLSYLKYNHTYWFLLVIEQCMLSVYYLGTTAKNKENKIAHVNCCGHFGVFLLDFISGHAFLTCRSHWEYNIVYNKHLSMSIRCFVHIVSNGLIMAVRWVSLRGQLRDSLFRWFEHEQVPKWWRASGFKKQSSETVEVCCKPLQAACLPHSAHTSFSHPLPLSSVFKTDFAVECVVLLLRDLRPVGLMAETGLGTWALERRQPSVRDPAWSPSGSWANACWALRVFTPWAPQSQRRAWVPGEGVGFSRLLAGAWTRAAGSPALRVGTGLSSLVAQLVKDPPTMQKTGVQSLGWEDPLEEVMATHSSILGLPLWLSW